MLLYFTTSTTLFGTSLKLDSTTLALIILLVLVINLFVKLKGGFFGIAGKDRGSAIFSFWTLLDEIIGA